MSLDRMWSGCVEPIHPGYIKKAVASVTGKLIYDAAISEYTEDDLDLLYGFTKRIQCICLDYSSLFFDFNHPALRQLVSSPSTVQRAFPKLERLYSSVQNLDPEALIPHTHFLVPSLLELSLASMAPASGPENAEQMLRVAADRCPRLQHLELRGKFSTSVLSHRIDRFSIVLQSDGADSHMRAMDSVRLCPSSMDDAAEILRSLAVDATTLLSETSPVLPSRHMETLSIVVCNVQDLNAFIRTLAKVFPTILTLNINKDPRREVSGDTSPVTFTTMKPLLELFQLVNLSMQVKTQLALADEDLKQLAEGLPLLKTLKLVDEQSQDREATIAGVLAVASHCPRLSSLTLRVNTTRSCRPDFEDIGEARVQVDSGLECLDVWDESASPDPNDVAELAIMMAAAFGRLRLLELGPYHRGYIRDAIKRVREAEKEKGISALDAESLRDLVRDLTAGGSSSEPPRL
ncbi:hypothetical protein CONPUDRAFT_170167 [Coniophora puteana RWD-64-598 SS2]|uniref:RNI-like protein n=1 Tax=Coniophora puteana (strain RWD-64-598) TaxID=741705 RepID=R7SFE6_CONPW|nr:uncharacterized protein CONPUDRAFT_170167 [Coniophora puteana RWD-64-598 SS2]EIW74467.1 hypothetical protein CONPUDRAFT_170167 [Coniophora puteana RWD-64-598 SS2]